MNVVFVLFCVLAALLIPVALVARGLFRAWFDHAFRMALLERLEHRPALAESFPELEELLRDGSGGERGGGVSFAVMGLTVSAVGVVALLAGRALAVGRLASGLYFGGVACVPVGFALVLAGVFFRLAARGGADKGRG